MLEEFLHSNTQFGAPALCPEVSVYSADSLVRVWEAAEALAGTTLPAPFWAFPWPAGVALARIILDEPGLVAGRRVVDMGAGGGISCLASAHAGAAHVTACDVDPWALAVTRSAAARQNLRIATVLADAVAEPAVLRDADVVLCCDLGYDRTRAPLERAVLQAAHARGATLLVADAGRKYFDAAGLELIAQLTVPVVQDLEGASERLTRVYRLREP